MRIALVNTNRIHPPIAPIGLEYIAEVLAARRHAVEVLDLCWTEDWQAGIAGFFASRSVDLIGVTLRNTDDCAFTSRQSFVGEFQAMIDALRRHSSARIILGGVGFSVMPEQILSLVNADAGVWGEGEWTFAELAKCLESKKDFSDLPNLLWRKNGRWQRNAPFFMSLTDLPLMIRDRLDNRRYFREGGQAGIETKRGCPGQCVYCADPIAKGRIVRLRPPQDVVNELESLLSQGIDHFHTCDCEFNLPPQHALEICREMNRRRLGERMRWYAYLAPKPFSKELAGAMAAAGCAGINFGVDHGDPEMLRRLGRNFKPQDIRNAAALCRAAGIAVMFDILIGSPGESEGSIRRAIELLKGAEPDRVGVAVGVRVYPRTILAGQVREADQAQGLWGSAEPGEPLFFLEPQVGGAVFEFLDDLIAGDPRFFFFDPKKPERNYNYNANQRLVEAIRRGYRGAYWDILRRLQEEPSHQKEPSI